MTLKFLMKLPSYDIMSHSGSHIGQDVTIRWAQESDRPRLERLAVLDSKRLPPGPLLVAVVGDSIWAALSIVAGTALADPFEPSADLVGLLRTRATQLAERKPLAPLLRLEP